MTRLFGDLLPDAVPVALSPLPIIAVAMLLLAPAGTRGALAFLAGRLATRRRPSRCSRASSTPGAARSAGGCG
ncbi:MAG TPA: hypothetical protein VM891_00680 [Amaricoccus sp.]|nr:hypothetical protein [Amaricoccus sp.]